MRVLFCILQTPISLGSYNRLTDPERASIIKWYYDSQGSFIATQRRFRRFYNSRKAPHHQTIINIIKKLEENSTIQDLSRKVAPVTARTPSNIRKMKDKLADSPHRSSRRLSRELQLSRTTVRRILHDDLNLFSNKIQILQKQDDLQKEKRVIFSNLMAEKIEKGEIDVLDIDWSDETHFDLNGQVKSKI